MKRILVTGGAGYIGSRLVPHLLLQGYYVRVLDMFLFENYDVFNKYTNNENLKIVIGDIRDSGTAEKALKDIDYVIHLAALSNDPSSDLDPYLTKKINLDATKDLIITSKKLGIKRFVFPSSATIYGIKNEKDVTEKSTPAPITLYGKYKLECEKILSDEINDNFTGVILRPATVCGYSPRMRFDLTVNIFVNQGINSNRITVYGGEQMRPNINIRDIIDIYDLLVKSPIDKISGEIFNAGFENYKVIEIANIVKKNLTKDISIEVLPLFDNRSYHINSEKISSSLRFHPKHTISYAVKEIATAFQEGLIKGYKDSKYYNIQYIKEKGYQKLCQR